MSGTDVRCDAQDRDFEGRILKARLEETETSTLAFFQQSKILICMDRRKVDKDDHLNSKKTVAVLYKSGNESPDVLTLFPQSKNKTHVAVLDSFARQSQQGLKDSDHPLLTGSVSGQGLGRRTSVISPYLSPHIQWGKPDYIAPALTRAPIIKAP